MKKQWTVLLLFVVFVMIVRTGFCAAVTDNNKGNKGYILINNGSGTGHQGTWTDIKSIPELKGEKGDKGDKGDTGLQGVKGDKGDTGIQGIQGEKGDAGATGANGKDFDPVEVTRLDSRIDTTNTNVSAIDITQTNWNKKQDTQLSNHETRIKNNENKINDLDNRVEDLEKTQYVIEGEVRVLDTKKWTVKPFIRYSETRSKFDTVGVRFTYKIGKSYEEKRIDELEKKLKEAGLLQEN